MLKQLYINNFTLIDTLDIQFNPGFSVITGETGAGKSIILGAINLLLGQRADTKYIKQNTRKCVIEAHFDISRYEMQDFFSKNGIDYDAEDCILRREISPSGKSRAFINDTPVPLSLIKGLGGQLIDIHSQHQNLLLNEEDFQINVIDIIADDKELLAEYKERFNEYRETKKDVRRLQEEAEEGKRNEDFMRFQLKELTEAGLKPGIQEELEHESNMLSHVEEIKTTLYNVENILGDNETDSGMTDKLKEAVRSLESITEIYPETKPLAERLESCYIELKDILQDVSSSVDGIEFDPQHQETVDNALDKIYSLEKKHNVATVEELLDIKSELESKLDKIDNGDEEIAAMLEREHRLAKECATLADKLTAIRTKAAKDIERGIPERLIQLGIPKVRFAVKLEKKELGTDGHDAASFLFSANTSTQMQPVAQVASGGEIARVMLSLKAMISGAVKLPTIIFDEIDTGVSGKVAEKMADIMQEMAHTERQVISITHLPQIAAKGSTHYRVYKEEGENGTTSKMCKLSESERIKEIAQMLSGSEVTEAAISNAKELLKQ